MSAGTDLQSVLETFLPRYLETRRLHPRQRAVLEHVRVCRTPALGGLRKRCERCQFETPRYHACRDRHCPKCGQRASTRWAQRQLERVLPVRYYHVVFTVPDALNPAVQCHPEVLYQQLFASVWATLQAFAAGPRGLGGRLGMTAVLHTWGQTLVQHVHLHCLIPGGVLRPDGSWRAARGQYLFPVRALSRRFRGHFVGGLRRHAGRGALRRIAPAELDALLDTVMARQWVVYAKPCLGHTEQVVGYLARYSHRIALSDARLSGIEGERVGLSYTDYRDGARRKTMWLAGTELLRRFLLHVLPKGLMRIRHYGLLANRCRARRLAALRAALDTSQPTVATRDAEAATGQADDTEPCPRCTRGKLRTVAVIMPCRLDGG